MCRMCDDPSLTMADVRAEMFRTIEKHGWMVQYVEAEPGYASFAYTIGLTGKDAPELYVTDLDPQEAARLLNDAARAVLHGDLGPCDLYTGSDGRQYLLGQMVDVRDLLGTIEAYGPNFEALSLTPM